MTAPREADEFAFHLRVVDRNSDPWYHTNWDHAVSLTVRAATKAEAFRKAWAVMGECPRGRVWTARVKHIESVSA